MKWKLLATSAVGVVLTTGGVYAASAKFAADWASDRVELANVTQVNTGSTMATGASELLALIHIPNGKDALVGVSGEVNLITFTQVKGGNKDGTVTSEADSSMDVDVRLADHDLGASAEEICASQGEVPYYEAAPGKVTFASRKQTLAVTTDLSSSDGATIEGYVQVALTNDTTAAHSFQFVAADLPSADYDVAACFSGAAFAEVTGVTDANSTANAVVAIRARMLTVQQVRAVKGSIDGAELIDITQ